MTQDERKDLIFVLYNMLPYGVKYNYGNNEGCDYKLSSINELSVDNQFPIEEIKPYLRPMSSMTKKEREESIFYTRSNFCEENGVNINVEYATELYLGYDYFIMIIDWLSEHHFDYMHLIPRGLALEAPEGMYKTE